jgi:hypothetical protein
MIRLFARTGILLVVLSGLPAFAFITHPVACGWPTSTRSTVGRWPIFSIFFGSRPSRARSSPGTAAISRVMFSPEEAKRSAMASALGGKGLSHSWLERAGYDRCRRVVGLHKNDQPGRCRSCRSGQNRHESRRAPVIFRLLRYHAAKLRQNRHRRRRLAVRRAFASILISEPDSGMLVAMETLL